MPETVCSSSHLPDLTALVGRLTPDARRVVLGIDQHARWKRAQPLSVEDYLRAVPGLVDEAATLFDLVLGEFLLRQERGEHPAVAEYRARFPALANALVQVLQARTARSETAAPPSPPVHEVETVSYAAHPEPWPPGGPVNATLSHEGSGPPGNLVSAPASVAGYEILGVLGRGGMGVVYRARQVKANRTVALKMILASRHASEEHRLRFQIEAEAVARLQHPHIVQLYEVGECEGRPFFALEFCDGGSLDRKLKQQRLTAPEAAALVETLARAMHYAHLHGVVHRDLKPANVLLTADGVAKVTDFGLARRLDAESELSQSGDVVGTPAYMAPEQAAGRVRAIGPPADVYALGAILYEMLAGRPPFAGAAVYETIQQVLTAEPVRPSRVRAGVPRDLEIICLKCLQKDAGRRYASAEALADDLRRFQTMEPITARPVGALKRASLWARRRPAVAGLLAVLAVVGVGGFGLVTWQWGETRAALARADHDRRERALAQVNALRDAAPGAVPGILADLERSRADVLPRLRELWAEEGGDECRHMRVALALLPVEPETVREPLLGWMLKADDPAEVLLVRDALQPHAAALLDRLWRTADTAGTGERFRALVTLAAFDPQGAGWAKQQTTAVEVLVTANPLHLGTWARGLHPVRGALLAPLGDLFRTAPSPEQRAVAALLLADYAADRPDVLADLIADANSRQFALLLPVLRRHEQAVALLRQEVTRTPLHDWMDPPLDPGWAAPDAALKREVEEADGLLAERIALCQTLPLDRFEPLAERLQRSGYRPIRLRPYAAGDRVLVAALWTRDGRAGRMVVGVTAGAVRARDGEFRRQGFMPVDVAAFVPPQRAGAAPESCAALWVKADDSEESRLYVAVRDAQLAAEQNALKDAGFIPSTMQAVLPQGWERPIYSGVWRKGTNPWKGAWRYDALTYTAAHADQVPMDVSLVGRPDSREQVPSGLLGWLASSGMGGVAGLPWPGLYQHSGRAAPPEPWYAAVWHERPDRDVVRVQGLDAATHQARCRQLAAEGYRPAAISVAWLGQGGVPVAASVWQRPAVNPQARERLAARQARAAVALLRLGDAETVWPLLRLQPDPEVRSEVTWLLDPLGADARLLVRRLETEKEVSARRALILSLGAFDERELSADVRQPLTDRLLQWYREDPDPGVHAAIDWLLRQAREGPTARPIDWGGASELAKIERQLEGKPLAAPRRWYVAPQGHTMTVIPGPVEFLMGTPATELDRNPSESPHRRRIGQSYAIASKPLTVRQWEAFHKAHPEILHEYAKRYSPEPDCPICAVSWYDAAEYCRWLSELDPTIPPDQYVYPTIGEIERAKSGGALRMPPNYLSRTGYRLPTEAEWEYACRAGITTSSRSYGDSPALLSRYAWFSGNAQDRSWPVGQKPPNDFGLFDMHGNVCQWCQESLLLYPPGKGGAPTEDVEDLRDVSDRLSRVVRGSAFAGRPQEVRSGLRLGFQPASRYNTVGLRIARTCDSK